MKSSIKAHLEPIAEQEGKGLQPIIAIKLISSENDEDTRDYTLRSFFDQLGETSKWLKVKVNHQIDSPESGEVRKFISIYPVHPSEFPKMVEELQSLTEKDVQSGILIGDNSTAFRNFLDDKKISYVNKGHFTLVLTPAENIFFLGKAYQEYLSKTYPAVSVSHKNAISFTGFDIKKSSVDLSIFESFCTIKNIQFYYNGDFIRITSPEVDAFEFGVNYINFKNKKD